MKAKCPVCGREDVTINKDGSLRVHADRRDMPAPGMRGGTL